MAFRFTLGPAGSGKSRLIRDEILRLLAEDPLGPPVYLLVPKQATFDHERYYTCQAKLRGFARLRVVSFESLGDDVLRECGGHAIPPLISHAGRQMLIGHLLRTRAGDLSFYSGEVRQPGLVRQLEATFSELDRAGATGQTLADLLAGLDLETAGPEHAALVAKSRDLALLGQAYLEALGNRRIDPQRRLDAVLKYVPNCRSLREAHVFLDAFHDFSAYERKLIVELASACRHVECTLTLDPQSPSILDPQVEADELFLFHRGENTFRALSAQLRERGIATLPPNVLEQTHRFATRSLSLIERDWKQPRPAIDTGEPEGIEFIETPDARAEVDAVARRIRRHLDDGLRLRDIVVLARDVTDYEPLIEASFAEHGIEYFVDKRRPAIHHPLVRTVRAALNVCQASWPHEAVMTLARSGLCGLTLDEADRLENYVLDHRLRGARAWEADEPWHFHARTLTRPTDEDEDVAEPPTEEVDAEQVDALRRRLRDGVAPLRQTMRGEAALVAHFVQAVCDMLDRFAVRDTLASWIDTADHAGRLTEAAEHEQTWTALIDLLDHASDLLGDEPITPQAFIHLLEYGLELFDLAIAPPAVDEVLVGAVDRTRVVGEVKAVLVLGMNEGTFPLSVDESIVLGDQERALLRARGLDVAPERHRLLLDERFLAYLAFTRPTHTLTLTRPLTAGGNAATASQFWQRLNVMFPSAPMTRVPAELCDEPDCLGTPRQLVTSLTRFARHQQAGPRQTLVALYDALRTHDDGDALTQLRRLAWPALSYDNEATLSGYVAQRLFGPPLRTSVSRIESFARCPFQHFARFGLKLRGRDDEDVTALDLGNVHHAVLERVVRRVLEEELDLSDLEKLPPEAIGTLVGEFTERIGSQIRGEIFTTSARNRYLLRRVDETLRGIIAGQRRLIGRGDFRPVAAEVGFGMGDRETDGGVRLPALSLKTPKGREVLLYGKIDRVDLADGGQAMVIDYKYSKAKERTELKLGDAWHGLALQLLVYLLVIREHGSQLPGMNGTPRPAAALYVRLLGGIEREEHPADAAEVGTVAFDLRFKPRGIIAASSALRLDPQLPMTGKSEVLHLQLKKDGNFAATGNDAVDDDTLAALLDYVRERVAALGDQLLDGQIHVSPYRLGQQTPCSACEMRSVCRFEPGLDPYHHLDPMSGRDVLVQLAQRVVEGVAE